MAGFQFNFLSNALNEVQGTGVSFASQAKKWETEDQGKIRKHQRLFPTICSMK